MARQRVIGLVRRRVGAAHDERRDTGGSQCRRGLAPTLLLGVG